MLTDSTYAEKIETLVYSLLDAQLGANRAVLENLLSDDYVGTDPDGSRVSKAEEIENLITSGYTSGVLNDVDIKLHGNTAVVTGKLELTKGGTTHKFSFTDVYMNHKLIACQAVLA